MDWSGWVGDGVNLIAVQYLYRGWRLEYLGRYRIGTEYSSMRLEYVPR